MALMQCVTRNTNQFPCLKNSPIYKTPYASNILTTGDANYLKIGCLKYIFLHERGKLNELWNTVHLSANMQLLFCVMHASDT